MWHGGGDNSMILAGFAVGVVILVVVAVTMLQFSRKLPIGRFFFWSSLLMAILAVVLTGKGVAALQEAGWLSVAPRSEEHTSELQSLMRISYAVFCLKKKKHRKRK